MSLKTQYKQNKNLFPPIRHELKDCAFDDKDKLRLKALLERYEDVFYHEDEKLPACTSYQHRMNMSPDTKPWKQIQYRYNPVQQEAISKKISELEAADIIEKSQSEYLSPIILV